MKLLIRILIIVLLLVCLYFISRKINVFPLHDFLEYWTAGKINLNGGNPYSPTELFALQKQLGWQQPYPLMMFIPPWLLPLLMPFSIIPYAFSRLIWFLFELFVLFIAADTLWSVYGGEPKFRWLAWVVVLAFGPTLQTLKVGQVTPFMTLGLAGFLFFFDKERPLWAGVAASMTMFKPHLLYLYLAAFIFWILKEKQWRVFLGFICGFILPSILAWGVNPNIIEQYLYSIPNNLPTFWITTTIGSTLRLLFGEELFCLQFLPSIFGLIWLVYYWLKNRNHWEWKQRLPLIILVSITTTSYGWAHDLSILVVAIIPVLILILNSPIIYKEVIIFVAFWSVSLLNAFANKDQNWFWWLAGYYLFLYLIYFKWCHRSSLQSTS